MRLLLDTHAFLWWVTADPRLSVKAADAIREPANERFLSAASAAEVAVKTSIGKLRIGLPVETFIGNGMRQSVTLELPVQIRHAYRMATLPLHHRDPFDRLLVATALEDGLVLVTDDAEIRKYGVATLW
jgi:PIN domain nuclease of toxin-antitoxin system